MYNGTPAITDMIQYGMINAPVKEKQSISQSMNEWSTWIKSPLGVFNSNWGSIFLTFPEIEPEIFLYFS